MKIIIIVFFHSIVLGRKPGCDTESGSNYMGRTDTEISGTDEFDSSFYDHDGYVSIHLC